MLRCALILALSVVAYGSKRHIEGLEDETRIVGGYEIDVKTRPFQVSVKLSDDTYEFLCGGSIISADKIVTAAHCVDGGIKLITVRAGSNYTNKGGVTKTTVKFTIHPLYNRKTQDYDVAVIDLKATPLTLNNSTIKAVRLTAAGTTVPDGTQVITSGWGTTSENGRTSNTLMEVKVLKVNTDVCKKTYGDVTNRMLCAGVPEGGKDSCQGDSGGPLVLANNTLVGIVSFGYGCARPATPGVYSNVAALRSWIKQTAGV